MKFGKGLMWIGILFSIAIVAFNVYIHDGMTGVIIVFALSLLQVVAIILFIEMSNEDEDQDN